MQLLKTDKTALTADEILTAISDYERDTVPELSRLWDYYKGEDRKILDRKAPDPNNPDNKVPVPYGRKIVTTFTGYAYRPKYITYKPRETPESETTAQTSEQEAPAAQTNAVSPDAAFMTELQATFDANREHIKTSRAGRNTGIFGLAYELMYIDGERTETTALPVKAEPRFFSVDPRELILYYDFSSEPKKQLAIRYYKVTPDLYKVEVYDPLNVAVYDRKRERDTSGYATSKWTLTRTAQGPHFYDGVPVVPYYFGDEMTGIMRPVLPLIDAYDILISDAMNEGDRFASAYLIMKKTGLVDPNTKEPSAVIRAVQELRRRRIFERLPADAEISYLTKDIPTGFLQFMAEFVRDQIHVQSHVPDFTGEKMAGASGIAIQRLLFDFENVCSANEADFDEGLYERIRLIASIYRKAGRPTGDPGAIVISHKRNVPLDLQQFAQTAQLLKNAGFSREVVADIMPDDIIPDVDAELARQDAESQAMLPSVEEAAGETPQTTGETA